MRKSDYKITELDCALDDLKGMLLKEHQKYSKKMSTPYESTGEDFADLYYSNLALLDIIQKQDKMIKNIYNILDRHESGLG